MPLTAGERLGPYEIVAPLGAGGMGEVYRARDTRIGREVAIKVSAERFTDRFNREARAIASLNHPNICTLHDVGPNYLVMELVEGPTLGELIERGPIPPEEGLAIVRQIADALEAAHEIGIVHRDLKPGNIKIKPDGAVKVLDFGLAKLGGTPESHGDDSPTFSMAATQAGVILGTAAYMAPEQARGKPVDKRADIWGFGVVLHEMLTGKRLFSGGDVTETLASVIKDTPRFEAIPPRFQPLLRRCLEKDPRKRLRDIGDALPLLDLVVAPTPAAPIQVSRRNWLWPALAALGFLAAAAIAFVHLREQPQPAQQTKFQIPLPAGRILVTVSPNGRRLAYLGPGPGPEGQSSIWVRELDSLETHRLAGTEDTRTPVFWSPDSRFIAFQNERKLKKVDASGGLPQVICDTSDSVIGGSWSRTGTIIFADNGIQRVPDSGGAPVAVDAAVAFFPSFLPDGRHFLSLRPLNNPPGIVLGSIDTAPDQQASRTLLPTNFHAQYVPSADPGSGYILFLRGTVLLAQPFDTRRLALAGEAIPIAEHVGSYAASGLFSASENGVLVYRGASGALNQLSWFDRQGKSLGSIGEPGFYSDVMLSPDGSQVVTSRFIAQDKGISVDLVLLEPSREVATRFTFFPGLTLAPVWSPDSKRLAFNHDKLYEKPAGGAGSETVLLDRPAYPTAWSSDGRYMIYAEIDPKTRSDLWILSDPGSPNRKSTPLLNSPFSEGLGQFSPDSRWILYQSDESGVAEIYVQSFPLSASGGIKRTISQGGGDQPRWRRDGKEILFFAPDGSLLSVDISTGSGTIVAGSPHALFRAPVVNSAIAGPRAFHWDLSADGKRFLIDVNSNAPPEPSTVVMNWPAQLKK